VSTEPERFLPAAVRRWTRLGRCPPRPRVSTGTRWPRSVRKPSGLWREETRNDARRGAGLIGNGGRLRESAADCHNYSRRAR